METERKIRIAVDGPSSAGKSSLARVLAKELGLIYVDTGAMYRTVALYMVTAGIDTHNAEAVGANLDKVSLELAWRDGMQTVILNGEDVGDRIRTPAISLGASAVSAIPAVRAFLLTKQKELAVQGGIVMDGRDIGTVIIPDAEVKLFLTAKPEIRAKRRVLELREKGIACDYEQILQETLARDEADRTRPIAPLIPAADAVQVDNSEEDLRNALRVALDIVKHKTGISAENV